MAQKIYTKTGDLGLTSLIGGTKVPKSNLRIETYGTVDELNSYIGLVSDMFAHDHTRILLKEVQDRLFTVGSSLELIESVSKPLFNTLPSRRRLTRSLSSTLVICLARGSLFAGTVVFVAKGLATRVGVGNVIGP